MMTPKRKQWWDSLPQREKMLREQIKETKSEISYIKFALQIGCFTDEEDKCIISQMKKQKITLTALKHELDCSTKMVYTGNYEGISPIYRCKKCGGIVVDHGQWCCPWCGREIKEWIESQKPGEDYSWVGDKMPLAKKGVKK